MLPTSSRLIVLFLAFAFSSVFSFRATHLGGFVCKGDLTVGPAFLTFDDDALIVSRFTGDPLESDDIAGVVNFGMLLASGNVSNAICTSVATVDWPNDVEPASAILGVHGNVSGLLAPGGFLVPGKTIGSVNFVNSSKGATATKTFTLSAPKILPGDGWFYHRAYFFDVDGDGLDDVITARATKPLVESPAGELVWMRQPSIGNDPLASNVLPWKDYVLVNGSFAPDVLFSNPSSLRFDNDEQIFSTSFFTGGGLTMLQCVGCGGGNRSRTNTWAKAAENGELVPIILDASIGPSFDVAVVDINGDGRLDLLVTNHVDNATSPGAISLVTVYQAPTPPTPLSTISAWVRHDIASGFVVREPGPNQAAPGAARAFAPPPPPPSASSSSVSSAVKPWVSVAGDGDQQFYVLTPDMPLDPLNWNYTRNLVWNCGGTAGRQATIVIDTALYLIVPCYDSGRIEAFLIQN